jgi:cyclopropane-fatty-acyl-phospholipid synthase
MTSAAEATYAGASQGAIKHHYDVGNEFWRLWLDPTMSYSCALWEDGHARDDGDTLERAQLRKLDHLLDGVRMGEGTRLLDVGCGWGGMLRRAIERGAREVVGLTLSEAQHEFVSSADPRLSVELTGWSDYRPVEPFDAIVSVGAFEHFAKLGLTREEKVESYRHFFHRCHEWLRPGGWMSLQTIAKGDVALDGQGLRDFSFIVKKVFPESDLPHPADVVEAIEQRFELVRLRNDREHYVRTCEVWLERLVANREAAIEASSEDVYDVYKRYLEACIRQFSGGNAVLLRFVLRRIEPRAPFRLGARSDG